MKEHAVIGASIRDAVARGDVAEAKRGASLLLQLRLDDRREPTWRQHQLVDMNAAATELTNAKDLAGASRGLAGIARACGDCHAGLGGPSWSRSAPPSPGASTPERMRLHKWGADRLWDGLVVPTDQGWSDGARAFADPIVVQDMGRPESTASDARTLATRVHELGSTATSAATPVQRASVFADLMTSCATCHERLGVRPGF